jgi:thiamine-phosphate pyrophosphorylase
LPIAPDPIICWVTDRLALPTPSVESLLDRLAQLATQVDWIQLREKDLSARDLAALTRRSVELVRGRAKIIVNDRLDVAIASGASGVHLSTQSLPIAEVVRWRAGHNHPQFLIGASCHSAAEARAAQQDGADYVIFGPIFTTPKKPGRPQGLPRLTEVSQTLRIPVLAIGGIEESNASPCIEAGAKGIAAIRLFQQPSLPTNLRQLLSPSPHTV